MSSEATDGNAARNCCGCVRIPMMAISRSEVMAISAERSEGRNTRVRQGVEKEERRQVPVGSARVTFSTGSSALFVLPCAPLNAASRRCWGAFEPA